MPQFLSETDMQSVNNLLDLFTNNNSEDGKSQGKHFFFFQNLAPSNIS